MLRAVWIKQKRLHCAWLSWNAFVGGRRGGRRDEETTPRVHSKHQIEHNHIAITWTAISKNWQREASGMPWTVGVHFFYPKKCLTTSLCAKLELQWKTLLLNTGLPCKTRSVRNTKKELMHCPVVNTIAFPWQEKGFKVPFPDSETLYFLH